MEADKNPFSPGAGSPPPELTGRDDLLGQAGIAITRIASGKYEQSMLMVGLRGVGKTVLLNRIKDIAEQRSYTTAQIEISEERDLAQLIVPPLRQILYRLDAMEGVSQKVKRGLRVLSSFIGAVKVKFGEVELSVNVDAEKGTADSGDLEADLTQLLVAVGEAAKDRKLAVAIVVDEMQYLSEREMSALIMAIHRISQQQLPVILVGAGLPQLVGLAGRSKSYAERLFTYPSVGPLDQKDAREALQGPVGKQGFMFESWALDEIVRVTEGYPYFLQEWGYQAWNIAGKGDVP
jgi:Cdc6-like AAA superfamily ATPase